MTTYDTSREIPATIEEVFAAISDPERLARWWGPEGFTNTFHECEFQSGGIWNFTMHSPDGHSFKNENIFEEVEPLSKIVVRHQFEPKFRLTIGLETSANGTLVSWSQAFDDAQVGDELRQIVVPANEQNLDRLTEEIEKHGQHS